MAEFDASPQFVIIARLADFCRFASGPGHVQDDAWSYMRQKLLETEPPIRQLKARQLASARDRFILDLKAGRVSEEALSDFKALLDSYLSPSDFVDAAVYLAPECLSDAMARGWAVKALAELKPLSLFDEEAKPPDQRPARVRKLVEDLSARLGLDRCIRALERKPRTPRRKRMVLRRMRANVAEYCSVLHIPTSPEDTFSPFMLPRVEAVAVACLRLLNRFR